MSDGLKYYYERFKELPDTARLLAVVTTLGLCSLYVLGLVSLIAGPRLRQAPVAYAEAVIYVTSTPTSTPTPETTDTPTPEPTDTPAPTATPTEVVQRVLVAAPGAPTVEATPTQRSYQPIPAPTEPRAEPTATSTGRVATPTPKPKNREKGATTATRTPTRTATAVRKAR